MIYLVFAIFCSVAVSVLLKILRQHHLDIRQTIVMGYPVAFLLTWILLRPDLAGLSTLFNNPISLSIVMALGVLLPLIFVVLGRAIDHVGIIKTDAAQRLSLIIPIISAFVLFGESLTPQRGIGIGVGFLALLALVYRPQAMSSVPSVKRSASAGWLLMVWLGYGVIDILFKQVAKQGAVFSLTLLVSFALAGTLLLAYLLIKRIRWQKSALLAGVLLGVLNMGNIYAYVKAHQTLANSPSVVFTGMNVGVIAVASMVGMVIFKERLSGINVLGIGLAIGCVLLLFMGG